jgi:monoamine oxidase
MSDRRIEADVCVVGAGYAGLTAARRLNQGGRSVAVVESRDRVGGRVWTWQSQSGVPIDIGGTFVGPNHDRLHALAKEMGVSTHPTYVAGDSIIATGGKVRRYRGDVPKINPIALLSAGQAIARLDAMAKKVPVDAPWDAPKAEEWDAQSVRSWLSPVNVPTRMARDLLEATVHALFCCGLSEVSLLDLLFLIKSAGGLNALMNVEGGYQQDQFVGGAQSAADAMAAELGDSLVLESPARVIRQRADSVEVVSDRATVAARHAVIAIPPALAGHLQFDPPLPGDRALLLHQLPAGAEIKIVAVYDTPFWRDDGVSGASVALDADIEVSLDTSPPAAEAGQLALYGAGPKARRLATLSVEDRRGIALDILTTRFGPKASSPTEVVELDWADEEWTRGCSMAHFPPGVLTQFGRLLRQPLGHIHWAGSETAGTSHGAIDGAVRSGERVAAEILG